jgi:hypothetical protein
MRQTHREGGVQCSVVPRVDQRSAQRYAEHVAGSLHEVSNAKRLPPLVESACRLLQTGLDKPNCRRRRTSSMYCRTLPEGAA